jgi:hypothetical protein
MDMTEDETGGTRSTNGVMRNVYKTLKRIWQQGIIKMDLKKNICLCDWIYMAEDGIQSR